MFMMSFIVVIVFVSGSENLLAILIVCLHLYCWNSNYDKFTKFVNLGHLLQISGADPGFQVRGGVLKKIAPSGGRRENFWVYFVWKITILRQKIFCFSILGGRAGCDPPTPGSAPEFDVIGHDKLPVFVVGLKLMFQGFLISWKKPVVFSVSCSWFIHYNWPSIRWWTIVIDVL